MSSPDRFSDNRYKNWLKCGLALIVMKEDLHQHVNNQVQILHNYLISKVSPLISGPPGTVHCGVCTWQDIKYDRRNKLWYMNCSKNICNVWLAEIIAVHTTPTNSKINWQNCNISQWPSDPYQVAKAFMPNGQANVTKLPEDLDPPAVLSLIYYCSFLCKNVPNAQILLDLIGVRNSLFHSGNFYVEDLEKDTWINNMLQLLHDLKLAGTKIEKIKREDLDINFREMEIKVFEALVSTLNSDFKTMYAALNTKINSLEDGQKEQEEKMGKLQVCCSESTVNVATMETRMESFEKLTQDLIPIKTFFDNNSDILDHDLINENTNTMSKLQDHFENLRTKLECTDAELTSIKSMMKGVEDLDRKVSGYSVDLEKLFRKLEMLSSEFVKFQQVIDIWNKNKTAEKKNTKSTDQTLGHQEQRSFQQDRMPAAWTFTKEDIDRAWVPLEGLLVEDLAPSYILSSLTFLSDNERQAICQMESRGEMVKVLLCRVKEQLPDAFCVLLSALKERGPEQLVQKLVKIIRGTCILNYAPKSSMSSLTMKFNVKEEDGTIVSKTEREIARSIKRVSSVFSEDLQLMVTDVIVGSVIIHLQPLSEHAQAILGFFCKHGGIKDVVLNLLRKKDIYSSLPVGEVWIEVEVSCHEEDVVSQDASEPWKDITSENFEVVSTDHVIKENLRLQYGRLLDEIEPLHFKKTFTDKGILEKCFLELRDLERRRERAAYFLDKLLAIGSDEALVTLVDALKESGRENLATNLVVKRTPYLSDTDDKDESLIRVVTVSQKYAEGSILWSCCLKVDVENNDDDKHVHTDGGETSGHVTDALPTDHSHGMKTSSHSSPNSGPTPVVTWKELKSHVYKMNHKNRGMAIIINNKSFEPHLNLSIRTGTDVDGMALLSTFNAMGFDVKIYNNQTVQGMKKILYAASKENDYHHNSDCFMCAILTHGYKGDILYGTDDKVDIESILSFFKGDVCPGLVGKPKIFFIQACQGKEEDHGVAIDVAVSKAVMPRKRKIHIEADILWDHSFVPGYSAWRHEKNGSCFIQALTKMLIKNWKTMDLLTMLTHVNQEVANKMTETKEMQIPMITSTLTKDVFFTPKES